MKKHLFLIALLLISPLMVAAAETIPDVDIFKLLTNITNYLFGILLATAVIFFIIAGFNFVTAQGDPEKVKRARDFVLWAIIGLLVAFVSVGLVNFIKALAESSK